MIYGFLSDTAAWLRATGLSTVVNYDQGAMFMDEQTLNYFNTPARIGDNRSQRLTVSVSTPEVASGVPDGKLHLILDNDQMDSVSFASVTASEYQKLFNILETCFTTQDKTAAYLSAAMAADSNYDIFLSGTLTISADYVTIPYYYLTDSTTIAPRIRSWINFQCVLAGQTVEFKIWADLDDFKADYPHTTMTAVIYPCDPALILTLNTVENVAKMLQESSLTSITASSAEVSSDDHTGVFSFKCKYNNSILGIGRYSFYFGVVYKGRTPSREEARQYIKTNLLADTNTTEDIWIDVLPDLFSRAAFYLVPIWSNYTTNAASETIKSGVYDTEKFINALKSVYSTYTVAALEQYAQVLVVAASDVLLAVLPSEDNDASSKYVTQLHPTYMGVATASPLFSKQAAVTQEFSEQLNDTMGTLIAAGSGTVLDADEVMGKRHLSFSVNSVDYHVLIKADYPAGV